VFTSGQAGSVALVPERHYYAHLTRPSQDMQGRGVSELDRSPTNKTQYTKTEQGVEQEDFNTYLSPRMKNAQVKVTVRRSISLKTKGC
jgi:hypothetical protein